MVKKNVFVYKICEYLFFIIFFIIYPFFQETETEVFSLSWSSIVITAVLCIWLFITTSQDSEISDSLKNTSKNSISLFVTSIITLILLFVNMFFWIFISYVNNSVDKNVVFFDIKTSSLDQVFCLLLQVSCVAFFEELLFRHFLPLRASFFLKEILLSKPAVKKHCFTINVLVVEIVPLILFAIGHLYLGVIGFFNSLIAGICLRFLYKKAHSVIPGSIVHTIYNLLLIVMYCFV